MKIILLWIPLTLAAIANGFLREFTYGRYLSELRAHQISCFIGIAIFWALSVLLFSRFPLRSKRNALLVGAVWLALTVAFEFGFGHYVAKHSWDRLWMDYNMLAGRLWPLVLTAVFFAPLIGFIWNSRVSKAANNPS